MKAVLALLLVCLVQISSAVRFDQKLFEIHNFTQTLILKCTFCNLINQLAVGIDTLLLYSSCPDMLPCGRYLN